MLQFGTVQWVADVINRNRLDSSHGITLQTQMLANTDAGRVALMAKSADIVTSDWTFVATQRAAGTKLCFAPFSSSTGGVMVQPSSPVRSLTDLAHRRLGVAGGPLDKSWLIVRAAAKAGTGLNLAEAADVVYGAPPLLNAKLQQNELDAVLTYWNFAARLEVAGSHQIVSVSDCTHDLGFASPISLVGFVFHQDWAEQNPSVIGGFLSAITEAEDMLVKSETEWRKVRPVMNAADDALFESFRRRFIEGIAHPSAEMQEQAARKLFDVLLRTGGKRVTDGLDQLPPEISGPHQMPRWAMPDRAARILSLLGLIALWWLAARFTTSPQLLPGPVRVLAFAWRETLDGALPWNVSITIARVAAAFTAAMLVGGILGYLAGRSARVDAVVDPWAVVMLNLPVLVVVVLAYIWIGLNDTAAVLAVAIAKVPGFCHDPGRGPHTGSATERSGGDVPSSPLA